MKDKGQRQKKFKEKLKFYWIRVGKHIALIAVLLAYAFAGAPLFLFLEKPEEIRRYELAISQSAERQANFTAEFGRIFNSCRNSSDCENLIAHVVYEYELQLGMLKNGSAYDWDFWNSMFYAGTIITTIGYGHMYCRTFWGQLATIIYAFFGIPLVLTVLNDLGKLMLRCTRKAWRLIRPYFYGLICFWRKEQKVNRFLSVSNSVLETSPEVNFPLPLAIFMVFGFTFICSATFKLWETNWDYFKAFYFFYISLTTIGLGDIVPDHPKFCLLGFGYMILGLALVSMCINIIQAKVEKTYAAAMLNLEELGFGMIESESCSEDENESALSSKRPPIEEPEDDETESQQSAVLGVLQVHRKIPSRRRKGVQTDHSFVCAMKRSPIRNSSRFGDSMDTVDGKAPSFELIPGRLVSAVHFSDESQPCTPITPISPTVFHLERPKTFK